MKVTFPLKELPFSKVISKERLEGCDPPVLKRQGNLWQQAGPLGEAGFKLKDLGGGVQSGNAHTIATNWGISQAN